MLVEAEMLERREDEPPLRPEDLRHEVVALVVVGLRHHPGVAHPQHRHDDVVNGRVLQVPELQLRLLHGPMPPGLRAHVARPELQLRAIQHRGILRPIQVSPGMIRGGSEGQRMQVRQRLHGVFRAVVQHAAGVPLVAQGEDPMAVVPHAFKGGHREFQVLERPSGPLLPGDVPQQHRSSPHHHFSKEVRILRGLHLPVLHLHLSTDLHDGMHWWRNLRDFRVSVGAGSIAISLQRHWDRRRRLRHTWLVFDGGDVRFPLLKQRENLNCREHQERKQR
mmetsp:Transcript_17849/g.67763  ORF Transcript_17849/g.67763 Transcript_17849/m.67763 type:complete len:278 (-) Transcript_17849:118-951(-)